jgi:hypothetical protein
MLAESLPLPVSGTPRSGLVPSRPWFDVSASRPPSLGSGVLDEPPLSQPTPVATPQHDAATVKATAWRRVLMSYNVSR